MVVSSPSSVGGKGAERDEALEVERVSFRGDEAASAVAPDPADIHPVPRTDATAGAQLLVVGDEDLVRRPLNALEDTFDHEPRAAQLRPLAVEVLRSRADERPWESARGVGTLPSTVCKTAL